jgi:hypothetical protein
MTPRTLPSLCAEAPALFSTGEAPDETVEQTHADRVVSSVSQPEERNVGKVLSRSMSLFEIDESLSLLMDSAVEAAAENNGEIPAELQQALLDYCEAFGQKVDNIARYIRSQEFEAANAKVEIGRLEQRKAAAEHRVERLKGLLKFFIESRDIRSMKGMLNTISLRKNSQDSLILTDTTRLPAEFWRVALVLNATEWQELLSHLPRDHAFRLRFEDPAFLRREPDTGGIRAALAGGGVLEGAELRRGSHIRVA